MANPEFQEGQQDSFVDESEYFGAFYERGKVYESGNDG